MQGLDHQDQIRISTRGRTKLSERMIYLPGAVVILYGFWLLLTA